MKELINTLITNSCNSFNYKEKIELHQYTKVNIRYIIGTYKNRNFTSFFVDYEAFLVNSLRIKPLFLA